MMFYKKIVERFFNEKGIYKDYLLKKTALRKQIKIVYLYWALRITKKKYIAKRLAKALVIEYQSARVKVLEKNKKLIDITDVRDNVLEKYDHNLLLNTKYKFYYDETNNYRVFWIKNGKLNESPEKYSVLGGICLKSNEISDFTKMEKELRLPKNLDEIKSNNIIKKNKTFIEYMNSRRLNTILKWIDQNGILMHFEAVDHLEIIAEDLCELCCKNVETGNKYIFKSVVYDCMKKNIEMVQKILAKNKYPNIDNKKIKNFLLEWREFILDSNKIEYDDTSLDLLGKKLFLDVVIDDIDSAINNHYCFEKRNKIIENYLPYYLAKPIFFRNSKHIFDEEKKIMKLLEENTYIIEGEIVDNYLFINSKKCKLVQICDVMVCVMAKFLEFVNTFEIGKKTTYSVQQLEKKLSTQIQKENFLLLMKIIRKSQEENKLFIRINGDFGNLNALKLLITAKSIENDTIWFGTTP